MSEDPSIDLSIDSGVACLTLNNPARRNAFTHTMREELVRQMTALNRDPEVRAVILTGEGKHFCVGADISATGKGGERLRLDVREAMKDVHLLFHGIASAPKPYVAAVGGDAFGAGMALALACDFVVAGPEARFGTAFARIGGYPELAMSATLGRRVGAARAKGLLMLCEHVHAPRALEIGLIDELTEGDHLAAAQALARQLAEAAPLPLAYIKAAFAEGVPSASEAISMELDIGPTLIGATEDSREGIAAFREKRQPRFTGR